MSIVISSNGKEAYVTDLNPVDLYIINLETKTKVDYFPVPRFNLCTEFWGIAMNPKRDLLYFALSIGINAIDLKNKEKIKILEDSAIGIVFSPDGMHAYATLMQL